ncbi:MAG: serine hydrolase [Gammaproteobacteria bacterium]|nr:serine hydrolase [Gammaproteobacteria bacterium]
MVFYIIRILSLSIALVSSILLNAQIETALPLSVGMSSAGLEKATMRLQQHVDDGDIAGVTAAIARDGKLIYFESLGLMDIEKNKPMQKDALFRTYSMTRQITTVAALMLYQEGKFKMDDPIQMYLPEFEGQRVLIDPQSTNINQTKDRLNDITIHHLITHTSGLGSRSSQLYRENRVRDKNFTLDQVVSNAAQTPLFQDPGTEFRYGIHATILGKLVEVWSGRPLNEFLENELLSKLDMNSTMFWAGGRYQDRVATVYRPTNGELAPYQIETVPFTNRPQLIEGGVGLLSSVLDFVNFSQMILDGGIFQDERILKPEIAELIYENAVPEAAMPIGSSGYWIGSGWTWGGFNLVLDSDAYNFPVSEGTIWWDGSAGTRYFIDRKQNIIIVIMAQVSPSSGGGFRENFSCLVDASIIERR